MVEISTSTILKEKSILLVSLGSMLKGLGIVFKIGLFSFIFSSFSTFLPTYFPSLYLAYFYCVVISSCYFLRSQTTNEDYIRQLDIDLGKILEQALIWLIGDFNLPYDDWENFVFRSGGRYLSPSKAMLEIAIDHNLFQKVTKPTWENSNFTNTLLFIKDIDVIGGISAHDIIVIEADVKPKLMRPK